MVSLDQFKETYLTESTELLVEMEQYLVSLTPETADSETLNAIFRCAHSIKGGAGAFGLDAIAGFTHVLEALLDKMREGEVEPSQEAVDALLQAVDVVTQMVDSAKEDSALPEGFGGGVLEVLESFCGEGVAVEQGVSVSSEGDAESMQHWQVSFAPHEGIFLSGNEPLLILRELSSLGDVEVIAYTHSVPDFEQLDPAQCYISWNVHLVTDKPESAIREVFEFVEDHCALVITKQDPPEHEGGAAHEGDDVARRIPIRSAAEEGAPRTVSGASSIRVDIDKVDRLVNMVGELVITEAMLRAQTQDFPVEQFAGLIRGIDELSQHTRELQEAVMSVRMQQVKTVFSRMPRIVRDLSSQLGKDINLSISGENTEVDKTVIEQLGDPLTHMIRNSCDHGIETPEDRIAKGKSAQGTIYLSAEHRGGRIVIEIKDDGAGINREKVLAKVREKGLISADDVTPSNEEIDHMIFMAGFSTAEEVTNVSGRGVGMDVVRRNIEGMGGTVAVVNDPGNGSCFVISLPLTLAILDGMIVRVGEEYYIIPITNIIESMRPRADAVKRVEGHRDVINVRGEFIPVIYLHRIFDIKNSVEDPSKALVVLVESNQQKIGLVVDELIGQQQVVIKSLEANTNPVQGVSGATVLGDGRVSLILEINDLAKLCDSPHTPIAIAGAA